MTKRASYGAQIKRGATVLAHVGDITGPELTASQIDTTTHDSASAFREYIAGLLEAGELTFDIMWDPDNATHQQLRTDFLARTSTSWSVTWTDPTPEVWSFTAFVARIGPAAPVDGVLTASVTIKPAGAVSIT